MQPTPRGSRRPLWRLPCKPADVCSTGSRYGASAVLQAFKELALVSPEKPGCLTWPSSVVVLSS